jgi:hypothetical protein
MLTQNLENVTEKIKQTSAVNVPKRQDPILADLWAVKAELNAAAGYDVTVLLERAAALRSQLLIPTR